MRDLKRLNKRSNNRKAHTPSRFLTFTALLSAALWPLLAIPSQAQQSIDVTIQGGVVRPIALAIPNFTDESGNSGDLPSEFKSVISNDLASTGLFRTLPADSYLEGAGNLDEAVTYSNWSGIGTESLIRGAISTTGDQVLVKFRLYDVVAGKEVGEGLQFAGGKNDWRRMAHKISDAVYTRITGEGPYFDSRIAFVSEKGPKNKRKKTLAIMDTDGANLHYLTSGREIVLAPRFAKNNRDIIFTSYESGMPQIIRMDTQSGNVKVLSDLPGLAFAPRFSPDHKSLVVSLIDKDANTDLYTMNLNGGQIKRITTEPSIETAPSFSPDGKRLVFESDRSGKQQLYVMSASGGKATKISKGKGRYATPVWSPRGDLIAFTKIEGGKFHIGVMNIDGNGERILTSSFMDEGPTWAPNGRVLMFFRQTPGSDGAPQLYSISLTGQNMVKVKTPDYASDPTWSGVLE